MTSEALEASSFSNLINFYRKQILQLCASAGVDKAGLSDRQILSLKQYGAILITRKNNVPIYKLTPRALEVLGRVHQVHKYPSKIVRR